MSKKYISIGVLTLTSWLAIASTNVLAVTADNVVCTGCVQGSDLAKNAVTKKRIKSGSVVSSKLKDGAVINSKIATDAVTGDKIAPDAVGSTEVINDSLNDLDIANEPGLDFSDPTGNFITLGTSQADLATIDTITMTLPSAGYVTCTHSNTIFYGNATTNGRVYFWWRQGQTPNTGTTKFSSFFNLNNASGQEISISGTATFAVPAGINIFELQAYEEVTGAVSAFDNGAVCMFFPTKY